MTCQMKKYKCVHVGGLTPSSGPLFVPRRSSRWHAGVMEGLLHLSHRDCSWGWEAAGRSGHYCRLETQWLGSSSLSPLPPSQVSQLVESYKPPRPIAICRAKRMCMAKVGILSSSALLPSGQLITHLGCDFPPGAGVLDVMYESPSTLLSCGYDTYVRYWDLRTSAR